MIHRAKAVSDERRKEIVDELKRYFAEVDASRKTASPEKAEEILSEALSCSRLGYREDRCRSHNPCPRY
jgi:vacuolar-type H+-ATPase subunit H